MHRWNGIRPRGLFARRVALLVVAAFLLAAGVAGCSPAAPQRQPEPSPPAPQPLGYPVLPGGTGAPAAPGAPGTPGTGAPVAPGAPPPGSTNIAPPAPPQRPAPYDNNAPADLAGGPEKAGRLPQGTEISRIYPGLVFRFGSPNRRQVALTFDDVPDNRFTPQILDALKAAGVKATFFVIGSRAEQFPEVVARMVQEGHAVGNHTYSHAKLTALPAARVTLELEQTRRVIKRISGIDTHLFRPPYGSESPAVLQQIFDLGYKVILWDVDSLDWKSLPKAQVIDNDLQHAHNGAVFLHHGAGGKGEDLSGTVEALPVIIQRLRRQGYEFMTIPQLLGISE